LNLDTPRMTLSRVEQAARNNAIWCDSICRAHGVSGEFHEAVWLNRHPVPRFYPNLVTLTHQRHAAAQLAYVQDLVASGLAGTWAVKDSFCELNLDALGFQLLFEATWLWQAPTAPIPNGRGHGNQWVRLQDESELAKWETAWIGAPTGSSSIQPARIFLPALLSDPNIAFIAAYHGSQIVAGAIANRTGQVVGLSNIFTPSEESVSFWAGCVATANYNFPGLPLVGYEGGQELALAQAVGFEKLQNLRVWAYQQ
jgi:hypothetical protein